MIGVLTASLIIYMFFVGVSWVGIVGGVIIYLLYYFIAVFPKERKEKEKEREERIKEQQEIKEFLKKMKKNEKVIEELRERNKALEELRKKNITKDT